LAVQQSHARFTANKKMTMKSILSLIPFALFLLSTTSNAQDNPTIVGADRDEHNCIGSAGYQWSMLKKECIRIFEEGFRLDAVAPDLNKTVSAFVVLKSETENAQVEMFIPGVKNSILLKKVKKGNEVSWKNANYTLVLKGGMYTLSDKNKKSLYQGAASK
jgi:hypothetical protein